MSAPRRLNTQRNAMRAPVDTSIQTDRSKQHRPRERLVASIPSIVKLLLHFSVAFVLTFSIRTSLTLGSLPVSTKIFPIPLSIRVPNSTQYHLPVQIVHTAYGWNHLNADKGLSMGRSKFQTFLYQGIERHPWYRPFGWQELSDSNVSAETQHVYVFLDLETCYEDNYPNYGWGVTANSDRDHGRVYLSSSGGMMKHMKLVCPAIDKALDTPLLQSKDATFVLFDCGWKGASYWSCLNRMANPKLNQRRVSIVSESAHVDNVHSLDLGLPPPPIHPASLEATQRAAINNCDDSYRPFRFSFTGNFRHPVRQELLKLQNTTDEKIFVQHHFGGDWNSSFVGRGVHEQFANKDGAYTNILAQSQFAGVPRGDNLFSYRFTEVLSAAAIPVVYADGWVMPFSKALVDWEAMAVLIPEKDAARTMDYLGNVTANQRCRMRKEAYRFYQRYMSTPEGVIAGIVESLENTRLHITMKERSEFEK